MNSNLVCKHCGAPVVSRICKYCGSDTGFDYELAIENMEYPVLEYKNVNFDFISFMLSMIFVTVFGGLGAIFLVGAFKMTAAMSIWGIPFFLFAIYVFARITLPYTADFISVKLFGKETIGLVYGYMNSTKAENEKEMNLSEQTIKILIPTEEGHRFILCNTYRIYKEYHENTSVKLKILNDKYLVFGEKEKVVPV